MISVFGAKIVNELSTAYVAPRLPNQKCTDRIFTKNQIEQAAGLFFIPNEGTLNVREPKAAVLVRIVEAADDFSERMLWCFHGCTSCQAGQSGPLDRKGSLQRQGSAYNFDASRHSLPPSPPHQPCPSIGYTQTTLAASIPVQRPRRKSGDVTSCPEDTGGAELQERSEPKRAALIATRASAKPGIERGRLGWWGQLVSEGR